MSDYREQKVDAEAEAAAAEAGKIGGAPSNIDQTIDPAQRPVSEAGGGESEGFEDSEELLRRNAEHDDPAGNPLLHQGKPEADRDDAIHGEADHVDSSELDG